MVAYFCSLIKSRVINQVAGAISPYNRIKHYTQANLLPSHLSSHSPVTSVCPYQVSTSPKGVSIAPKMWASKALIDAFVLIDITGGNVAVIGASAFAASPLAIGFVYLPFQ